MVGLHHQRLTRGLARQSRVVLIALFVLIIVTLAARLYRFQMLHILPMTLIYLPPLQHIFTFVLITCLLLQRSALYRRQYERHARPLSKTSFGAIPIRLSYFSMLTSIAKHLCRSRLRTFPRKQLNQIRQQAVASADLQTWTALPTHPSGSCCAQIHRAS